ncbi:run domain Beclin-1-interacting and cysteine-rich domain-containing protein [Sabethes cyaneus]|uniref:run domain Beclin-1-interacting and cysteine-rich domain-containing protein n=1 Tax=Sabethes cyaneus TaxID=53552 RepID=UPI00237EE808|nr:run domain Beclin-1-interacting and cysteine-rich domain-containing protein [Sabethes cyaneus]
MARLSQSMFGCSSECEELLLELITAIKELRSHTRFKGDCFEEQKVFDESICYLDCPPDKLGWLHRSIKRIFTHRIKNNHDVWKVVEGLKFLNPAISLIVRRDMLDSNINDKGLLWIFQCVQQRCVSENLNWLITDKEHMSLCYENDAFLRDEKYADAMMVCFNAFERGQPTLLSQIDPQLYSQNSRAFVSIKRSESHPNLVMLMDVPNNKGALKRRQTIHYANRNFALTSVIKRKKTSQSLPNITIRDYYHRGCLEAKYSVSETLPDTQYTPSVPKFQYSDNSATKPAPSILNCENIKIYTESTSCSPEQQGCWQRMKNEKQSDTNGTRSDLFSLASFGSPRVLLNEFIPQCGEKINPGESKIVGRVLKELPSRPTPGQSLTSFLKTVYFSRTNTELDRENAHFSLSEALIATFEQLKWNDNESTRSGNRKEYHQRSSTSNLWTSYPGSPQFNIGDKISSESVPSVSPSNASKESTSTMGSSLSDSNSSGSCESSSRYRYKSPNTEICSSDVEEDLEAIEANESVNNVKSYSAEGVALSLLSKFNEKQLPSACDLLWLVSEQDAPQQILPMPKDGQIVNPDEQSGLNTIIRGTREWAPPRPQIIFTYSNPLPDRRTQMAKQNFRCAGCGMKVAPAYSSRFRYCHYLGKYNCSGCHKNQMSAIPAKIIERWDFTFYPVSSFSYHLLSDIAACPLYRINHLNPKLYEKVRILYAARILRINLKYIRDFIVNCRFADDIKLLFNTISDHLTVDIDCWSMADFISVRNGSFQKEKTDLIRRCEKHIFECELCIAHGFLCENCDRKEIIFPWQKRIVKCSKCGACFHEVCWLSNCVKCDRLLKRRSSKK